MSEIVPCAPYCTQSVWLDHFGAHLAVHGDDIAIDRTGQDSLAEMKAAQRSSLVQRFNGPGSISTTDLIDRMLHATTFHHLPQNIIMRTMCEFDSGVTRDVELLKRLEMLEKIKMFSHGCVKSHEPTAVFEFIEKEGSCALTSIVEGCIPSKGKRVIYVDGAFDLFTAGHASFLEAVLSIEKVEYLSLEPFLIVGIYDDTTVSKYKGIMWPVMNMVERALLLLQSRVSIEEPSHV